MQALLILLILLKASFPADPAPRQRLLFVSFSNYEGSGIDASLENPALTLCRKMHDPRQGRECLDPIDLSRHSENPCAEASRMISAYIRKHAQEPGPPIHVVGLGQWGYRKQCASLAPPRPGRLRFEKTSVQSCARISGFQGQAPQANADAECALSWEQQPCTLMTRCGLTQTFIHLRVNPDADLKPLQKDLDANLNALRRFAQCMREGGASGLQLPPITGFTVPEVLSGSGAAQ